MKRQHIFPCGIAAILLSWTSVFTVAAEPVTLETLLQEMTDREALARLDSPAYKSLQASSYDRRSVSPDQDNWFANMDFSRYVRTEEIEGRKEFVLLDAEGPGAVVRIWLTMSGKATGRGFIRVYIDGAKEPVFEGNTYDIISRGHVAPAPLSYAVSEGAVEGQRGHNLYLPIPYAKSCKITYEEEAEGWFFYLINYRASEPGTEVTSYSLAERAKAGATLNKVVKDLSTYERGATADWKRETLAGPLAPGKSRPVTLTGPAAIREIRLKLDAADPHQALRSTILRIEFDGKETVWCPVGDFFGTGYMQRPYQGWYTESAADGTLSCYWVMPFAKSATVTVENLGEQEVTLSTAEVATAPWTWDERSLHFHSTWKHLHRVLAPGPEWHKGRDVNYVTITGQGKYVGDTLSVYNTAITWWGEGDEKIYIDGETFPSHFGTGTEDYYGYAWCRPETFAVPFHAQPIGDGNGWQQELPRYTVNSRWRALDAIPFTEALRFDMELWNHEPAHMDFTPSTFWYGRPGASDNIPPAPADAKLPVTMKNEDIAPRALEGEDMEIEGVTGGKAQKEEAPANWSKRHQLAWRDAQVGDTLRLKVPFKKEPGTYVVRARVAYGKDYGKATFRLNGQTLKEKVNFHSKDPKVRLITLGKADFAEENILEIEITEADPKAAQGNVIGLDYVSVE